MFAKTAEDVAGKAAGTLFDLFLTPAAFFWLVGFAVWGRGELARYERLGELLSGLSDPKLLAVTLAVLTLISFSSAAYEPMNGWVLSRLAGNWGTAAGIREIDRFFRARMLAKKSAIERRLSALSNAVDADATEKFTLLERLRYYPGNSNDILPTRFGCALKAVEGQITAKYGLSGRPCWVALAAVLPEATRKTVADAQAAIAGSARLMFWTIASLAWLTIAPNAVVAAVLVVGVAIVAAFAYTRLVAQACEYADVYGAAFDVGREPLYKALRFPLPKNALEELASGTLVTRYLERGYVRATLVFAEEK